MYEMCDEWFPWSTKTNDIHTKNTNDKCFISSKTQFVLETTVVCYTDVGHYSTG